MTTEGRVPKGSRPSALEGTDMGIDGPKPDLAAPMEPGELIESGTLLYGRFGWMVRLAEALDKNPSTIRRWKSGGEGPGSEIPLAERRAIRALVAQRRAEDQPASRPSASDADHRKALRLVALAQRAAAEGSDAGATVSDTPWGLVLTVVVRGEVLSLSERDGFSGLDRAETLINDAAVAIETNPDDAA